MKINLKKEKGNDQIVLLIIPNELYSEQVTDISKQLADNYKNICYVSLNKLYNVLLRSFEDNKIDIDRFFFIDTITKTTIPSVAATGQCTYISSPSALTELSINITKVLNTGKFDVILFDSLSTLLIYNEGSVITRFMHDLMGKIRIAECKGIFTCLEGDVDTPTIKDLGMFVDKVIRPSD